MSTLTDLFNVRIGLGAKNLFVEILERSLLVANGSDRSGAVVPVPYPPGPFEDILRNEGVTKESVYCIVPPPFYYRNTVRFPFCERQKIESTIRFEVQDLLPVAEGEFLTDFLVFGGGRDDTRADDGTDERFGGCEAFTFSAPKSAIGEVLEGFGSFRENLRGLIPYDAALYLGALSVIDSPSFACMDIREESVCFQHIRDRRIERAVFLRRYDDEQYAQSLRSFALLLAKSADSPTVYVNARSSAGEEFRRINEQVLEELEMPRRSFPAGDLAVKAAAKAGPYAASGPVREERIGQAGFSDMIAIWGGMLLAAQPPARRVNLLKDEFKARPKGYLRLKDFVTLGVLLLALLAISLSNLFIDLGSARKQNLELKRAVSELGTKLFQKPDIQLGEAREALEALTDRIGLIEASIDRRSSVVEVLRELASYLPSDVVLEFTDIVVERNHVKFAGKAKTFADIDRIKEALTVSEVFSQVSVTNTGTTGSTEGFTVTFLFEIDVEPPGGPGAAVRGRDAGGG